jgi:hypothetical protein
VNDIEKYIGHVSDCWQGTRCGGFFARKTAEPSADPPFVHIKTLINFWEIVFVQNAIQIEIQTHQASLNATFFNILFPVFCCASGKKYFL